MTLASPITYPLPMAIAGVGRYLPPRVVSSAELEKRCGLDEGWCIQKQGVSERRWVTDETVTFMGAEAAREAIADAGLEPHDIDLILNASQSFDRAIPEAGAQFQKELGLGKSGIPCFTLNSGCLSFPAALDLSAVLIASGRYHRILIISSIITSLKLTPEDPMVFTMMGDGAGAVVVTHTPENGSSGVHAMRMETYSKGMDVTALAGAGFQSTLFSKSVGKEDFRFFFDPPRLQETLMKYNKKFMMRLGPLVNIKVLKLVIPNQTSRWPLEYMKLVYPADKIVGVIHHYGNCGAVGYPLALYDALAEGRLERGDKVMLTGWGAGFSIVGIVLTY